MFMLSTLILAGCTTPDGIWRLSFSPLEGEDPVQTCTENFADGTVTATDTFRPVSRYFDRITRPEQLLTALPRALRTMTDPADYGPVTLAFCQDVQAEAYDYPEAFFEPKVWRQRRVRPDVNELADMAELERTIADTQYADEGKTDALPELGREQIEELVEKEIRQKMTS